METSKNIYQRINAVMSEVDYIQKGDKKVNNMYRFVSHDLVTGTLHGPMTKHGIVMIPKVKEMKQDGNRTEIMVEVEFVNMDTPEDRFSVQYVGFGIDSGDKGPGKAISYACKYALLKVFCLETGDDPDNDAVVEHVKEPVISKDELNLILKEITKCDLVWSKKALEAISEKYGTLAKMPARLVEEFKEKMAANPRRDTNE